MRLAPAVLLLLACGGKLASTAGDVSAPKVVTFPQGWVGYPVKAPLTLTNGSASPQSLQLELPQGFSAEGALTLQGGESRNLIVTFSPTEPGAYELDAHLTGELTATVHLSARVNLPPDCRSSSPCVTLHFDPALGVCQSGTVPDGSSCDDPCIEGGVCLSGLCLGTAKSCDDGDACTADACGAGGCVHTDLSESCPQPLDPCQAAYCDPVLGCQSSTVADGTSCGPNDCVNAHVCIGGRCQQRPAPDGSLCAQASLCQGNGYCRQGKCDQPAAVTLTPKWTYLSPVVTNAVGDLAADASGNLYFAQLIQGCEVCEVSAPGPTCQVVSLDPSGAVRWIAQRANGCTRWAVDDAFQQVYVQQNSSVLDALALADGSLRWSVDATTLQLSGPQNKLPAGSDRSFEMVALGDSRGPLFARLTGTVDWVVGIDRATGTKLFDRFYSSGLGPIAADDQGVVFFSNPHDGTDPHLIRLADPGSVMLDAPLPAAQTASGVLQFDETLLIGANGPQLFDASSGAGGASFAATFWGPPVGDRYSFWVNDGQPFRLPDVSFPALASYDTSSGALRISYAFPDGHSVWEAMVTAKGSALAIADDDTGLHAATYLFEGDTRGDVLARCPLADEGTSGSLLLDGTLYLRTLLGVAAYDAPGYRLGTGWAISGGSERRDYHAR